VHRVHTVRVPASPPDPPRTSANLTDSSAPGQPNISTLAAIVGVILAALVVILVAVLLGTVLAVASQAVARWLGLAEIAVVVAVLGALLVLVIAVVGLKATSHAAGSPEDWGPVGADYSLLETRLARAMLDQLLDEQTERRAPPRRRRRRPSSDSGPSQPGS
jgi:heme/copper-type cytochrome/quinol oxidase subunit 2